MRDLAAKIVWAAAPSRSIVLSVKNMSSISPEEASVIEQHLRADLAVQGLRLLASDPAATPVDVTLSQNIDGFLWVAAIGNEPEPKVLILKPFARNDGVEAESHAVPILRRTVLLQQHGPILDFAQASFPGSNMLLLLEPEQITILRNSGKDWSVDASAAIHHAQPLPRDLRGHIVISTANGFEAFLPGVHCTGTFSPSLAANCEDSTATWPIGSFNLSFVNARNYLSVSAPAANDLPAAYSAAPLVQDSMFLVGIDGIQRSWTNGASSILRSANWGDDIAPISSLCGTDQQLVATGPGDYTQRDHLQPYQVAGSNASQIGDPIELPGPITALWSSENGNSVRLVSRDLQTGLYEASIVSISCGN